MTSNEILKADVLDILFENRNKHYGAYALRKEYDKRLWMALGIALSSILLLFLLFPKAKSEVISFIGKRDSVKLTAIVEPPIPQTPPPAVQPPKQQQFAQKQFTNKILLVDDNVKPTMPDQQQISVAVIGTATVDGAPSDGIPHPSVTAPSNATNTTSTTTDPGDFKPLERQPEFPGGIEAFRAFLSRNLQTPGEMEAGEKKTVYVKFIVNEDGTVTQFDVVQSAGTIYDKEVLRVLRKMPKWRPAVQNGHNVTTAFTQPVTFQVVEE